MNSDATTTPLTQNPPSTSPSASVPVPNTTTATLLAIPDEHHQQQTSLHVQNDRASLHAQLHRTLTDLAYLVMATIYYSDQMSFLLFSRWILVTNYAAPMTTPVLYRIPVTLLLTVPSMLFRWREDLPQPVTDASRGMLSGSAMVDVVGEFVPSRTRLFALDLLFCVVVLLMLVVSHEQVKAERNKNGSVRPAAQQDLDAEEQGVRRGDPTDSNLDAELRSNTHDDAVGDESHERDEQDGLLRGGSDDPVDGDVAVPIITLDMAKSLREIWHDSPVADTDTTAARARVREAFRGLISAIGSRTNRN